MGAVTPLGRDLGSTWRRLLAGEGGGGTISAFPCEGHTVRIACQADEFDPADWIDRRTVHRTDRFTQLALAAARMAELDAGLESAGEPGRVGAAIGTAQGGVASLAECCAGAPSGRGSIRRS